MSQRKSNIELLRIVAMLMIISYHIVLHCINDQLTDADSIARMGNGLFSNPQIYRRLFALSFIASWGQTGNVIFLLITGYFLVGRGKQVNLTGIAAKLLGQMAFAAIALTLGSALIYGHWDGAAPLTLLDINNFNYMSWFIGYYYVIVLMGGLFLNEFLDGLDQKRYLLFVAALFAVTQFFWPAQLLTDISYNLLVFAVGAFAYALGGYLHKYNPLGNIRAYVLLVIMVCVNALLYVSYLNDVNTDIAKYWQQGTGGPFTQTLMGFTTNSIVPIVCAVCLFELFVRLPLPTLHPINALAKCTLMVYLVHDNSLFYSIWNLTDWITSLHDDLAGFLSELLRQTALSFCVGVACYVLYLGCHWLLIRAWHVGLLTKREEEHES